jgi:hypothetical protein
MFLLYGGHTLSNVFFFGPSTFLCYLDCKHLNQDLALNGDRVLEYLQKVKFYFSKMPPQKQTKFKCGEESFFFPLQNLETFSTKKGNMQQKIHYEILSLF